MNMVTSPRTATLFLATVAMIAGRAPALEPASSPAPTKDSPLKFSAIALHMPSGKSVALDMTVERWSTDEERESLIALVKPASDGDPGQQDELLQALQDTTPRTGFIKKRDSLSWDLKYAYQTTLPDGGRQIVLATDKPVSSLAAMSNARTLDFPFTLIEMRFPAGSSVGEGRVLAQTAISTKDGRLQLDIYGQEPTRLTKVTQREAK